MFMFESYTPSFSSPFDLLVHPDYYDTQVAASYAALILTSLKSPVVSNIRLSTTKDLV